MAAHFKRPGSFSPRSAGWRRQRGRDTNTQGLLLLARRDACVCGARCLIALIVFVSPPKANTKNLPRVIVWESDQWREREICFTPERSTCLAVLLTTLEPSTVPITVSSHSEYDIASSHEVTTETMSRKRGGTLRYSARRRQLVSHQR